MTPADAHRWLAGLRPLTLRTPAGMTRPALLDAAIWVTPGARALSPELIAEAIVKHAHGEWGVCDAEDCARNDYARARGVGLLHSAYAIDSELTVWVITDADHATTTVLLPDEY